MLRSWWRCSAVCRQIPSSGRRGGAARRCPLGLEVLEVRTLPSGVHRTYVPLRPAGGASPLGTVGPIVVTPAQVRRAYVFEQITCAVGVLGDGTGQTISIVYAFDDPTIANDLHQFDLRFGLPDPPVFTKVNQTGGSTPPAANGG